MISNYNETQLIRSHYYNFIFGAMKTKINMDYVLNLVI